MTTQKYLLKCYECKGYFERKIRLKKTVNCCSPECYKKHRLKNEPATEKQLDYLRSLSKEVQKKTHEPHSMYISSDLSKAEANDKIGYALGVLGICVKCHGAALEHFGMCSRCIEQNEIWPDVPPSVFKRILV